MMLKLILSRNFVERHRALLDEMYPGVELYENRPVGEAPRFVGVLGQEQHDAQR